MQVKISPFSNVKLTESTVNSLRGIVEVKTQDIDTDDVVLTVHLSLHESLDAKQYEQGQTVNLSDVVCNWSIKYPDATAERGFTIINVANTAYMDFEPILALYLSQVNCKQHLFVRPRHEQTGNLYLDGRGVCCKCHYERESVLPEESYSQIASTSLSSQRDYPTAHDWRNPCSGDAPRLQGGDSGIVLGKESYTTAFFEAFPRVGGYSTFIRGEGKDIREAEQSAWNIYQRQLNCPGHEFSRDFRGKHHDDGYGRCIHCRLTSTDALPPETLCDVCGAPTKLEHEGRHMCYKHFFEEIDVEEHAREHFSTLVESGTHLHVYAPSITYDEIAFGQYCIYTIKKWAFSLLGEDEALMRKHNSLISEYGRFLNRHYEVEFINSLLDQDEVTGEEIYPPIGDHKDHLNQWLDLVIQHTSLKDDLLFNIDFSTTKPESEFNGESLKPIHEMIKKCI